MPSANCCTPKISGMLAKSLNTGAAAFLKVAMPMADMMALPVKLASAEKHIVFLQITGLELRYEKIL